MNLPLTSFDLTSSLDLAPYLTKGSDAGNGVTLMIGNMYTYALLGGGPLLMLAAFALVKMMYGRVKFFALEYGSGGFWGRTKTIFPSVVLGGLLFLVGTASTWLGWQAMGYSVTLNTQGAHEVSRGESLRFNWADAASVSERIKSEDFLLTFASGAHKCRLQFQQRYIGAKLQDKAIAITEAALAYSKIPRIKKDGGVISGP